MIAAMTASPARSLYRLAQPLAAVPTPPDGVTLHRVSPDDDVPLGRLLERAYAGTIDEDLGDNDDGVIEIGLWRADPGLPDHGRTHPRGRGGDGRQRPLGAAPDRAGFRQGRPAVRSGCRRTK